MSACDECACEWWRCGGGGISTSVSQAPCSSAAVSLCLCRYPCPLMFTSAPVPTSSCVCLPAPESAWAGGGAGGGGGGDTAVKASRGVDTAPLRRRLRARPRRQGLLMRPRCSVLMAGASPTRLARVPQPSPPAPPRCPSRGRRPSFRRCSSLLAPTRAALWTTSAARPCTSHAPTAPPTSCGSSSRTAPPPTPAMLSARRPFITRCPPPAARSSSVLAR